MPAPKKKPLRWISQDVQPSRALQLRVLTNEFQPMTATPGASPVPAATFDLPDLSGYPTPADKALRLLQAAVEVEHALMIQYLYAGYGFSSPRRDIVNIAIEEMSHLMTVQNLLRLLGHGPELGRQDFGSPGDPAEQLFPFELLLEPLTNVSLAKYVVAESPRDLPAGIDPALWMRIIDLATQGAGTPVNRVGNLYALLSAVIGSEQLLLQQAASGDPWYVMVNAVAAEAAAAYGGRDKVHLPDSEFQMASAGAQGSDREWDRSVTTTGIDEFRVFVVADRGQALAALKDIGLQGEGPSTVPTETSHFVRFLNLFKQFFGPGGTGTGPAPGAAAVPRGARIVIDEQSADPEAISHPATARWARLADARYAILLGSLETYLRQPPDDRAFLLGWCFAEMFALRKLSIYLTKMPRTAQMVPTNAALPFNLPDWQGPAVSWDDLEIQFTTAGAELTAILAGSGIDDAQKRILGHLTASDARKLTEVQARKGGESVRRKSDRAREILDWATGAGDPHHFGSSPALPDQDQGRFWNLPLDEFKQTEVFGENVVTPPAAGADAPLIDVLRNGNMPRFRPPLPTNESEFLFLEDWINQQCPDDPV